ncbi:MFS transporter [Patescibacteria group bacterium]|nr:MFS transporter [Patescibacteria group bacterium]
MNKINGKLKSTINRYYLYSFLISLHLFSAVLVPFFTDWGGISQGKIQILQSWFMFWIFILEIPTGAVADYIGRKQSLFIGSIFLVVGMLLYGSVPNFNIFLLGEFLFAAGVAFTSGANEALLYDALKEEGKEAQSKNIFGKAHTFHLLAILIAAPIGSFVASKLGLNFPIIISAVPTFIAAIVALTIKEPKYKSKVSESIRYINIVKEGIKTLIKNKELRRLTFNSLFVSSAAYFVIWFYQPLLIKINVPIIYFGFVHSFLVIVEIFISSNFQKIENFLKGEKNYMLFNIISTFLGFVIVGLKPSYLTITLFIIFSGGFGLTYAQYINAIMQKHISSEQRATVISSISMFRRFMLVLFNPVIGLLTDINIGIGMFIVGILCLISLVYLKNLRDEK